MDGYRISTRSSGGALLLASCLALFAPPRVTLGANGPAPSTSAPRFAEFEGTYKYHGGLTAALVATDTALVAVIDEAKYPLRPIGNDRFLNPSGDTIPFRRSASGAIEGFTEGRVFCARTTLSVDPFARLLVSARPVDDAKAAERYAPPTARGDGIAVADPTYAGYDADIARKLVDAVVAGKYPELHGVLAYRRGRLVLEQYFNGFDADRPHQMRSATKSVVSALVGTATDRKLLPGLQAPILPRFAYASYRNPHATKSAITLEDLLTHRTGLACDDRDPTSPGQEMTAMTSTDWVKNFLDLPVIAPRGTASKYCSAGVLAAGRMVELASGEALPAYAQRVLFEPLGIRASDLRWNFTLDSTNIGTAAQLYLRPRDMLKLGILYAQGGRWEDRQVISADWVRRSTTQHSVIGDEGHGYYWWTKYLSVTMPDGQRRVDIVAAQGNGGQKIVLVPSLDLVVVITAGAYNRESPSNRVLTEVLLPPLLAGK
jgi:CubicO group peptidase (beta-lactamase class C family)